MIKNDFLQKNSQYLVFFYFVLVFFLCWSNIGDYGATLDDYIYYINGENTYLYVKQVFLSLFDNQIKLTSYRSSLNEFPVFYELFLVFICDLLNINDFNEIFLTAHRVNFLFFFSSLLVFFQLMKKRFENVFAALLGITFLILSPRIFAESFYNSRDIFFMGLFIFYLNSLFNFLNNKNLKNLILFSFFTALLLNAKILGLIPIGLFCLLYIYNFTNTKKKIYGEKLNIFLFIIFCCIFIYISWPFLWDNPLKNLFLALKGMLEAHEEIILINYYFGKYIPSDMMPWHYRLVWFFITTPVIILFLFIFGFVVISKKLLILSKQSLNNEFEFKNNDFFDIFLILTFLLSFFVVLEFNISKFGGWRHLYYLYPITIYFSVYFAYVLLKKYSNIYKYLILALISLNLSYNFYWSIKNHPHQYVFFNLISKNYALKNFDLDWWGVSHKYSLEYILENVKEEKIKIFAEGFTTLRDSYLHLSKKDKKRIILTDYENADYIIDSKMKRVRVNRNIGENSNFKLIHELIIDGQPLNAIYKRL